MSPPVVLIPGLLCDARLWDRVRALLGGDIAEVSLEAAASLIEMADFVEAAARDGSVLVGFSMGGMAALIAASRAPERYGGLVILNTHAEIDTPARAQARIGQMARAEAGEFADLVSGMKPAYFATPESLPDERTLVAHMAHRQGPSVFTRHVRAILERPDLADAARRVRTPATVVAGALDALAPPEQGRRLAALLPQADFVVLEDCGHVSPLEQPEAVAAIIERQAAQPAQEPADQEWKRA